MMHESEKSDSAKMLWSTFRRICCGQNYVARPAVKPGKSVVPLAQSRT